MKWFSGASAGILAAGDGSPGSSSTQLNEPIHIIVDTNEYMYISDNINSRVIRWAPNSTFGVCIAACTLKCGTAPTQLHGPQSLAFDSNGSLYVAEWQNNRVQKFQINCSQSKNSIHLIINIIVLFCLNGLYFSLPKATYVKHCLFSYAHLMTKRSK
jgi:hypothetical protein